MFKRKQKEKNTLADLQLRTLWEQHLDVSNYLNKVVRKIITKKRNN